MGCDIHMFAEKRADKNSKWESTGKVFKNPYYSPDMESKIDEDGYEWNPKLTASPYRGRNYDLFSILADVRNGYGFAGCNTGEGFVPISEPKGLPDDVCEEIKHESYEWDGDGHSHSYFTVKELIDYDWNQITMKSGVIPYSEYKSLINEDRKPNGWSGGVGGRDIETIDMDVAEEIRITGIVPKELTGKKLFVNYKWAIAYSEHCQNFLTETIPLLQSLGDPENVRIVFWFDN